MDIRKPKPVHSFKEFLGEIAVIIIGVSIALAAEQVVEVLYWRDQVRIARESLGNDMAEVVGYAAEREAFSACIDQRLNRWSDLIEAASNTGLLSPQGAMHRAPRRLWSLNSWQALASAGIAPHLPRDQLYRLSQVTFYLSVAEQAELDENNQWTRLYTMVGPGRKVEAGELTELRAALSAARGDAKSLRLAAAQISRMIEATGILPPARAQAAKDAFVKGPNHALCLPDEPAGRYGDGPPAGMPLDRPLGR
jgi:hypothetical protein